MKKRVLSVIIILCMVSFLLGVGMYDASTPSGVLLSFDDYSGENWEQYFDMFDKYDAKVTFFINVGEPTDFCTRAVERGHEIAYHTLGHVVLRDLPEEEVRAQAIDPIETFREAGFELTSFAYPQGMASEELNELLLQYYKVLRGAYFYQTYPIDALKEGFVESQSLDNIHYATDEEFEAAVDQMLGNIKENRGTVASFYSHAIADGDWCIQPERLEYFLQEAKRLNLKFYTFKDLQGEAE